MRTAETVLGVIRERGRRRLPLENLYRQLYNQDLFLHAYGRLYRNAGALTPGATSETVDGMSLDKIDAIIDALRQERYQWTPVRRTYIPKKSGKLRPLGLPTWSDKLLQEGIRLLLEAYYEPQFSPHSHGFRPSRGCHTALGEITRSWRGVKWFIEGDISQCFDSLDHEVMLSILRERIHDNRFLRLLSHLLKAGYLEDWRFNATLSGSPQGGVVSPLLSNIYLDRLDQFVEQVLLPAHNRGDRRRPYPPYMALLKAARNKRMAGALEEAKRLRRQAQQMPSREPHDPAFRRLWYVRYADDWLLGFSGPREEAEAIKAQLNEFLRDTLKLKLSDEKTLMTNARTQSARFLGYEVVNQNADDKQCHALHRRCINGVPGLKIPEDVIRAKCATYLRRGKAFHRAACINDADYSIITQGIVNLLSGLSRAHLVCHTRPMSTPPTNRYKHHRFPVEIISHAVWLYFRFCLSYRDVEELLSARGVMVTYEAIRKWCRKFGQAYANEIRRRRSRPGDKWHLDEVFLTINGERHYLWRAVDQDGNILDILVQSRRNKKAAKKFFRKLLKGCQYVPRVIITDQLKSYGAAKQEMLPGVEHRQHRYLNNRAENSHQPTRQRERRMQGFKSAGQAQRFLAAYGLIAQHFRPRRHRLPAPVYRHVMAQRFQIWHEVTGTTAA